MAICEATYKYVGTYMTSIGPILVFKSAILPDKHTWLCSGHNIHALLHMVRYHLLYIAIFHE